MRILYKTCYSPWDPSESWLPKMKYALYVKDIQLTGHFFFVTPQTTPRIPGIRIFKRKIKKIKLIV